VSASTAGDHEHGDDGGTQRLIRTVHGKGFQFVGEVGDVSGAVIDGRSKAKSVHDADIAGPDHTRPVIAALPFVNLSDDVEQAFFFAAVTADIVANLSKHRWLDVIARDAMLGRDGDSEVFWRVLARTRGDARRA
jgi:hypothetical protein